MSQEMMHAKANGTDSSVPPQAGTRRVLQRLVVETTTEGMVQIEAWMGDELEFRAVRKGGLREGIRLAELFMEEGPEGFAPRLRGAEYQEIAQVLTLIAPGDRFTSHRVTDLLFEEATHDRSLVLKNVSSALTKLRKREVSYLSAAGKQGKSILYELSDVPTVAQVVADLQD